MQLDDFNYYLPEDLIAQHPLHCRDKSRLMVIDRIKQTISHDIFLNIGNYLPKKSLIVLNNSKVVKARLLAKRQETGGVVEIFLLKKIFDDYHYEVLMRPVKRLKEGEEIIFENSSLRAVIIDKEKKIVRLNKKNVSSYLEKIGHVPLPPYIKRNDSAEDKEYYQTVYASKEGSVASPTAGLHFTNRLLKKIKSEGHDYSKVTLHVSYGTFKPVEVDDVISHKMHSEEYSVTNQAFLKIEKAKNSRQKIVAVGTTSCRVLETIFGNCSGGFQTNPESIKINGKLKGNTNIFIYPGYKFQAVDCLITNFHVPKSTLLMLVYAFAGKDLMRRSYEEAIKEKYRFYSYGDGMLIL